MDPEGGQGAHVTATQLSEQPSGPLPFDSAQAMASSAAEIGGDVLGKEDDRPTVGSDAWLKQDDYWQRTTYIAVTGRHTAQRPATRPLPRPHRFRRPSPVRSLFILALTLALIVLIPIGVVIAQRAAESTIKLPTTIPGLALPTAAPTHTPSGTPAKPTVTPSRK